MQWRTPIVLTMVRDADPILATRSWANTTDAAVLDRCESWFSLTQRIVASRMPNASRVEF